MKIIESKKYSKNILFSFGKSDIQNVRKILEDVRIHGNRAVLKYTEKYDGVKITEKTLRVNICDRANSLKKMDDNLRGAIKLSIKNISSFSRAQLRGLKNFTLRTSKGVYCSQKIVPIERVGIYVPAGNFPLVSTLIMCAVPAKIAGVREIVVFSPPRSNG
ncbi:MAG: histidinol dehydrogenase, partial [Deltaproteobacteria bacterium]|nr:histidinol dehydrogenase [Deltaproteobacteria bacterium]